MICSHQWNKGEHAVFHSGQRRPGYAYALPPLNFLSANAEYPQALDKGENIGRSLGLISPPRGRMSLEPPKQHCLCE